MLNTNYRERFAKFFEKAREKKRQQADAKQVAAFKQLLAEKIEEKKQKGGV